MQARFPLFLSKLRMSIDNECGVSLTYIWVQSRGTKIGRNGDLFQEKQRTSLQMLKCVLVTSVARQSVRILSVPRGRPIYFP